VLSFYYYDSVIHYSGSCDPLERPFIRAAVPQWQLWSL